MTFSIIGRCERSGMLGVAITTSSICVGARCPHVRAGVGAVASQNLTDPALGPAVLDNLADGVNAADALRDALTRCAQPEHRQVTVIDRHGNTACHSGEKMLGVHGESSAGDCIAAGNLLANEAVLTHITGNFASREQDHLAERLLTSLEAGLAAGGEQGAVHSAALLVAHKHSFPLVDLRVDWHDREPVAALRGLWQAYRPQMEAYIIRATDPANAPAYAVPGDPGNS